MPDFLTSYTHSAEDILLHRVLRDVEEGFYIDIGAYHPEFESLTKIFYDKGWKGINVEPNNEVYNVLQKNRTRDINLNIAISDSEGSTTLALIYDEGEPTGLTTLVPKVAAAHAKDQKIITKIDVTTNTLQNIWSEYVPPQQDVHFLKIDVEGAEKSVIEGGNFKKQRAWILVIEAVEPLTSKQSHANWEENIIKSGYIFAWFDGLNRYYVASEKSFLIEKFSPPLNVATDHFIPYGAHLEKQALYNLNARYADLARQHETMSKKNFDLNNDLHRLDKEYNKLANDYSILEQQNTALEQQNTALEHQNAILEQRLAFENDLLKRRPRPLWEQVVFRSAGQPKKLFRRILFHTNGKPRGMFRSWVLRADGKPRMVFHKWMSGASYQMLPKAIPVYNPGLSSGADNAAPASVEAHLPSVLSQREQMMKSKLIAAMKNAEI